VSQMMVLWVEGGPGALIFAPAVGITYNYSQIWSLTVEHYADYGSFAILTALGRQYHALFGVVDYNSAPLNLEFGIGHGFSAVSESFILKLIVTRSECRPTGNPEQPHRRLERAATPAGEGQLRASVNGVIVLVR